MSAVLSPSKPECVDFQKSCNLDGWVGYLLPMQRKAEVNRFHKLYAERMDHSVLPQHGPGIPKTIHQIWLGSSLPPKFQRQTQMWKDHHPSWEYRLWTDDDLAEVDPEIRKLIDSCDCMAQKTDIMRVEILNRVGGLYVDVDYDCYKPCDDLLSSVDFVVTLRALPALYMQFPDTFLSPLYACTSFIGSVPGHPVLQDFLGSVGSILHDPNVIGTPSRLPFWGKINRMRRALKTTYNQFHEAVSRNVGQSPFRDLLLPPTYYNPIDNWWKTRFIRPAFYRHLPGFMMSAEFRNKTMPLTSVQPHSFGHHDSNASWL